MEKITKVGEILEQIGDCRMRGPDKSRETGPIKLNLERLLDDGRYVGRAMFPE